MFSISFTFSIGINNAAFKLHYYGSLLVVFSVITNNYTKKQTFSCTSLISAHFVLLYSKMILSLLFKSFIMKKTLLLVFLMNFIFLPGKSQNPYIDCSSDVFYAIGWGNMNIYKMRKTNNVVTVDSTIINQSTGLQLGLAIASPTGNNLFYSCGTTSLSAYNVLEYSNGMWNNVFSNAYPNTFANVAGYGNDVYFQWMASPTNPVNRIYKYSNGNFSPFWIDSTMFMNFADLAVDSAGSVYIFTGAQQFIADTMRVFASNGVQTAAYPVSFSTIFSYGLFIQGSTLYLGLGAGHPVSPNSLLPLNILNGQVILGTPMPVPHPVIGGTVGQPQFLEFSDLASCNSGVVGFEDVASIHEFLDAHYIYAYPTPCTNEITVDGTFNNNSTIHIYNIMGELVKEEVVSPKNRVDVSALSSGVYILKLGDKGLLKFVKQDR